MKRRKFEIVVENMKPPTFLSVGRVWSEQNSFKTSCHSKKEVASLKYRPSSVYYSA